MSFDGRFALIGRQCTGHERERSAQYCNHWILKWDSGQPRASSHRPCPDSRALPNLNRATAGGGKKSSQLPIISVACGGVTVSSGWRLYGPSTPGPCMAQPRPLQECLHRCPFQFWERRDTPLVLRETCRVCKGGRGRAAGASGPPAAWPHPRDMDRAPRRSAGAAASAGSPTSRAGAEKRRTPCGLPTGHRAHLVREGSERAPHADRSIASLVVGRRRRSHVVPQRSRATTTPVTEPAGAAQNHTAARPSPGFVSMAAVLSTR